MSWDVPKGRSWREEIRENPLELLGFGLLLSLGLFFPFILIASLIGVPGILVLILSPFSGFVVMYGLLEYTTISERLLREKDIADSMERLLAAMEEARRNPPPPRPPQPQPPSPPMPRVIPRWPGRTREGFPIKGPEKFVQDVNQVLNYLQTYGPGYYRDALEYLPQAEWVALIRAPDSAGRVSAARSDGLFAINADSHGWEFFLWAFLHETGHNVLGHSTSRSRRLGIDVEKEANEYARRATEDLGRARAA